jgi:hypothetical protein
VSLKEGWAHLETYNQERARGIVHTPEWRERMAREQERFDWYARAQAGLTQPRETPPPPPPPVILSPHPRDRLGTTSDFEWDEIRPYVFAIVGAVAGAVFALILGGTL